MKRGLLDMWGVEHAVTQHWDVYGGDVLWRTCSCGEEWARDEDDCPVALDDVGRDGERAAS